MSDTVVRDRTGRLVDKTLELLQADPRTAELSQMMPALMPMVASLAGAPLGSQPDKSELADIFQAMYDAWSAAAVHVADEDFRAASLAAGGNPVERPL
jgi:hypothetical protein